MADALTEPSDPPGNLSFAPRPVEVAAIERELTRLWQEAEQGRDTPDPVTRACMSNLLIFCAAADQAAVIAQEIGDIMAHHPARVLLLIGTPAETTAEITAHVSAQCHLADGGRQICSEHVTVNASGAAALGLPSVARPLLIGDLPTTLWWAAPHAPPLAGDLFRELADMAQQVIYDSAEWPDGRNEAARNVIAMAGWAANALPGQVVSDLSWRCLKPWRRLISQTLDPATAPTALASITDVSVEYGAHGLPEAWLLIGWLASCLGWQPEPAVEVSDDGATWQMRAGSRPLRVNVRRVTGSDVAMHRVAIAYGSSGSPGTARFEAIGPGRLTATTDGSGAQRTLTLSPRSRAALVARQLRDLDRDAHFRAALAVSRVLAASLAA